MTIITRPLTLSTGFLSASLLFSCFSSGIAYAETQSLPRKSGAVHDQFKTMLKQQIQQFKRGVGRIAVEGKSNRKDTCSLNLYTNKQTTFVAMEIENQRFYDEFYIDHPSQSFRPILFQNLEKNGAVSTLSVIKKGGSYSITAADHSLTISSKNGQGNSTSCTFDLKSASYFEGETE